jgi:hypothetical protein
MQKSKLQSTIGMKKNYLFQHHSNLFKTTILMKTNMDQWSKYTLIQRYNKIWTKIKAKNESQMQY